MSDAAYPTQWRRPPMMVKSRFWRIALTAGAILYLVLALGTVEVNYARVIEGMSRAQRFIAGFLQPDFTSRSRDIWIGIAESLTMTFNLYRGGCADFHSYRAGGRAQYRAARVLSGLPQPSSPSAGRCKRSSLRFSLWRCSASGPSRAF